MPAAKIHEKSDIQDQLTKDTSGNRNAPSGSGRSAHGLSKATAPGRDAHGARPCCTKDIYSSSALLSDTTASLSLHLILERKIGKQNPKQKNPSLEIGKARKIRYGF